MNNFGAIFKSEISNSLKNRWIFAYTILLGCASLSFIFLTGDAAKALLSLVVLINILVPLVSIIFCVGSWYQSESFTEILLAQPVARSSVFWARVLSLIASQALCLVLGLGAASYIAGLRSTGLLLLVLVGTISAAIFTSIGSLIACTVQDRMKGTGLSLAIWIYFLTLHDALLLFFLYWFREYPMDLASSIFCLLNPIGLSRVVLLMKFDAPLLLGHSGALVRSLLESGRGWAWAALASAVWLVVPLLLSRRSFERRDF